MKHYERMKLLDKADSLTFKLDMKLRPKPNKTKADILEIIDTLHQLVDLDCAAGVPGGVQSHLEELPRWYRDIGDEESAAKYTHEYIRAKVATCKS